MYIFKPSLSLFLNISTTSNNPLCISGSFLIISSKRSLPNTFSKNLRDEPVIPSFDKASLPALKPIRPPSAFNLIVSSIASSITSSGTPPSTSFILPSKSGRAVNSSYSSTLTLPFLFGNATSSTL